jgi:hypothetical protein
MPDAPLLVVAVIPFLVLAGLAIALVAGGRAARGRVEGWRQAFGDLGIEVSQVIPDVQARIEGHLDGLTVALSDVRERETAVEPGPELLATGLAHVGLAPARRWGREDESMGDEPFDRAVTLDGDGAELSALLDAATREAVLRLLGLGVRVESGRLTRPLGRVAADPARLRAAIGETLDLARRLRPPADLAARLAANAAADPAAAARRRCLGLLADRFSGLPATREALLAGLDDADESVRVRAAAAVGEAGHAALGALAGSRDDAVAVEAIAALGAALPLPRALELLADALEAGRAPVVAALVAALGRVGGARARERLVGLLAVAGPWSVAAARALAGGRDAAAEPHLVAALAADDDALRVAAADALAAAGTVAAVPGLHAAAAAHPFDLELRRAVAAAITAIRERATGAAPGQLSLAGGEAGRLAITDDAGGALSIADRPPGGPARLPKG